MVREAKDQFFPLKVRARSKLKENARKCISSAFNLCLDRRGSKPVSTVLRKSVRFFIRNIFLIIIVELSKLKSGKWSTCTNVFRALDRNRGKGTFACPRASLEACSLGPSFRKSVSIYPRSASDRDYSVSLTEHLYKTDLMVKRTPRVGPYLSFLPLFDWQLYKTDIALRQTLSAGPKVVRLRGSWL